MRKILLILLAACVSSAAWSANYYRLKNNSGGNYMTENVSGSTLVCAALNENSYAQVWEIASSGTGVTLRNALSQRYVQSASNWSVQYTTGTSAYTFTMATTDGVTTFTDKWGGGLHRDAANNVVLWYTSEEKSEWTLEPVNVDESELAAARDASKTVDAATLTKYFTTTACTALNGTYSGMTDANLRSAMGSLPAVVQDMALKVKNNAWATYSGWDKTERTYRVADYSPYSNSATWTNAIGLSYRLGRLSNPTGIYATTGDVLQVYVGSIPSGQSVALEIAGYGQGAGTVYPLEQGMNVVNVLSDGNCFVYYEVGNYNNGNPVVLSNFADVTVHIEGGTVQGYFDLTKGYTNADWTQLKTHLMSANTFCMKTKSLVFNLLTSSLKSAIDGQTGAGLDAGEVVELLTKWQDIQDMEDRVMGRYENFPETVCNNLHSVTSVDGSGALYAFTYGIYFSIDQHDRLFNYDFFSQNNDAVWASAHELGHHRQNHINMAGLTEVSNNIFSNVAIYEQGLYTSRTASISDGFADWQNGLSWPELARLTNEDGGTYNARLLRMNWQLYMFFHLAGYDTRFFPKLFSALRQDPMKKYGGGSTFTLASEDYLKFYEKCCEVSGYDLTEFFALYGFFRLPPEQEALTLNGTTGTTYTAFNDYSQYYLLVTQEMIDQALARVKAKGYKPCNALFIDDRIRNAEGRALYPGYVGSYGSTGTLGQWNDFTAEPSGTYVATLTGNTVSMTGGTGAVGFKIYDGDGNLIQVANDEEFSVSSSVAHGLRTGVYRLVAAYAESNATVTQITKEEESYQLYTIVNANGRGAIQYWPAESEQWVWTSSRSGSFSEEDVNCQWILYPAGTANGYYLYNVGAQQFVSPTTGGNFGNYTWAFSPTPVSVTLLPQSDGNYHLRTTADNIYMSVSNGYTGPVISYYADGDWGVPFGINPVGKASAEVVTQLKAALARFVSMPGDVNLDGQVTIADVTALVNSILNPSTVSVDEWKSVADVTLDGEITSGDVELLVKMILGK
ncbi:MAG: M60 family metallopeptidase [Prevotella sp.]|nr:M60 family metallopeptidase [Prevotella sp.]